MKTRSPGIAHSRPSTDDPALTTLTTSKPRARSGRSGIGIRCIWLPDQIAPPAHGDLSYGGD